jgi:DNA-binding LacI/PurR family transcriptional regulator
MTIDPAIAYSRMYTIDNFAHWCATHAPRAQTAWVFARTADAAGALQWARENHIGVPSPLSIIDLENNADYYREDISSCVPDWHGVGYLMAHTLLRDIPIERSRKGYIHTRAVFLDRATTP